MPKYDAKCKKCNEYYEWEGKSYQAPGTCPHCGSDDTKIVWLSMPNTGYDTDPYKMLEGKGSNPGPKIVSGPKYSSKTTVGK
jgi:hypothetical protein